MFRSQRGKRVPGVLLMVGLCAVVACSSDTGTSGVSAGMDESSETLELGDLQGQDVTFGLSLSGPVLPAVVVGGKKDESPVVLFDIEKRNWSRAPAMPFDGVLASGSIVAVDGRVVLSADVCASAPMETDTGKQCQDYAVPEVYVLALEPGADAWQVARIPDAQSAPGIARVEGKEVTLGTTLGMAPGDSEPSWLVTLGSRLTLTEATPRPLLPTCMDAGPAPLTFDRFDDPASVTVGATPANDPATFILPAEARERLQPVLGNALRCYFAGRFLMIPGNAAPKPADTGPAGAGEPIDLGPGPGSTPDIIAPGALDDVVYDLADPGAEPVRMAHAEHFSRFVMAGTSWARVTRDGIQIGVDGKAVDLDVELRAAFDTRGTTAGLVIISGNDGRPQSIRIVESE